MVALADSARALLVQPAVAAGLGLLLGFAMFAAARWSVRFASPDEPNFGMVRTLVINFAGMIGAFVALMLYYLFAREAIAAFGIGLIVGFVVPTLIAMFTLSGTMKTSSTRR